MSTIPRGQTPERQAYMRAWHAANPRDRSAYKSAYDATHQQQAEDYRSANRERLKAKKAAWYRANRQRILARVKAHAKANLHRVLAYQADYYATHTEKVKANVSAYRRACPEKASVLESRRRARKAGNGGSHTAAERREKFARLGNVCFYCGCGGRLTADHDVPLARGGTDNIGNILPACRSCNSRKNTRTASEFLAILGRTNHQKVGGVDIGR